MILLLNNVFIIFLNWDLPLNISDNANKGNFTRSDQIFKSRIKTSSYDCFSITNSLKERIYTWVKHSKHVGSFYYLSENTIIKCLLFSLLSSKALRRIYFSFSLNKVLLLQVGIGKSIFKFVKYSNLKIMYSGRHLLTVVLIGTLFCLFCNISIFSLFCALSNMPVANPFSNPQNKKFCKYYAPTLQLKWNSSSLERKWNRSRQKMRLKSPCREWLKATEEMNKESRSKHSNEYKCVCLAAKASTISEEAAREWMSREPKTPLLGTFYFSALLVWFFWCKPFFTCCLHENLFNHSLPFHSAFLGR